MKRRVTINPINNQTEVAVSNLNNSNIVVGFNSNNQVFGFFGLGVDINDNEGYVLWNAQRLQVNGLLSPHTPNDEATIVFPTVQAGIEYMSANYDGWQFYEVPNFNNLCQLYLELGR